MEEQSLVKIPVVWRGNKLNVEVDPKWNVKEFGEKLQGLTNVKPETMRLLVPQPAKKSSKMITPYSDVYSSLSLQEAAIFEVPYAFVFCFSSSWSFILYFLD